MNPMVNRMMEKSPPKLEGTRESWQSSERDWADYLTRMEAAYPSGASELVKLELLSDCLDPATKYDLKRQREMNRNLTYTEYYRSLEREFSRDAARQKGDDLRKVKINLEGQELTLQRWRVFKSEFLLKRSRIDDFPEAEEHMLIFRQTPEKWQRVIINEKEKSKKRHNWIKFESFPGLRNDDIVATIEQAVGARFTQLKMTPRGVMADCTSVRIQNAVLDLNNWNIGGHPLRVMRVEPELSTEEIFDVVEEKLRVEEELQNERLHSGLPKGVTSPALAVVGQTPTQAVIYPFKSSWGPKSDQKPTTTRPKSPVQRPSTPPKPKPQAISGGGVASAKDKAPVSTELQRELVPDEKWYSRNFCRDCYWAKKDPNHSYIGCPVSKSASRRRLEKAKDPKVQ
jgi:hypothetical protein